MSNAISDDRKMMEALKNIGRTTSNKTMKVQIKQHIDKNDNKYNKTAKQYPPKPKNGTKTDNLTEQEIEKLLEDYMLVDINNVPIGTHLRYIDPVKGFRHGGVLKNNSGLPKYVILKSATGPEWSVQVDKTEFYKKMTINEIKQEYENEIKELKIKIKKLKEELRKYIK